MPVGGDKLPERSLGSRATLQLENNKPRPYPVPRNVVHVGWMTLALAREEREALEAEQQKAREALNSEPENVVALISEHRDTARLAVAAIAHTVGDTPSRVMQERPDAPAKTSFVAVSMPLLPAARGLTSEG